MATQWVPGPLHSKGKIRVFLLQEVLFALVVHSVGVSEYMDITQHKHKKVYYTQKQQIRQFSFWEGRALVTSMLLW